MDDDDLPEWLTPGEVAELFRVDTRTVNRWARSGRLPHIRTLGGHFRFRRETVIQKTKEDIGD